MRAIRLHHRGGPEALALDDAPMPRAQAGELLIDVRAAGVTPTELDWLPTWTSRAQLANVARPIDAGDLRPLVGAVYDLADARSAFTSRPANGKNVVVIGA